MLRTVRSRTVLRRPSREFRLGSVESKWLDWDSGIRRYGRTNDDGMIWERFVLMLFEGVYNTKAMLLSSISLARSVRALGNFVCDILKYSYLSCVRDLLP